MALGIKSNLLIGGSNAGCALSSLAFCDATILGQAHDTLGEAERDFVKSS